MTNCKECKEKVVEYKINPRTQKPTEEGGFCRDCYEKIYMAGIRDKYGDYGVAKEPRLSRKSRYPSSSIKLKGNKHA